MDVSEEALDRDSLSVERQGHGKGPLAAQIVDAVDAAELAAGVAALLDPGHERLRSSRDGRGEVVHRELARGELRHGETTGDPEGARRRNGQLTFHRRVAAETEGRVKDPFDVG